MASSLIENKRITTTLAKAKALRTYVEPLITKAKEDSTHSRRVVFSHLQSKNAVSELFRDIATKIGERPGGYTRILRTGNRIGDNAEMCIIELVDYNEAMLASKAEAEKPKRRRSRRGTTKKQQVTPDEKVMETKGKAAKGKAAVTEEVQAPAKSEEIEITEAAAPEISEEQAATGETDKQAGEQESTEEAGGTK